MDHRPHIGMSLPSLEMLARFEPITLDRMESIRLMNRVDTKYVTTVSRLQDVLGAAAPDFLVLETESGKTTDYLTVYFDTPGRDMYQMHHDRRLNRVKVRTRRYLSSGATFLEVKRKDNHRRTRKKRTPACDMEDISSFGEFLQARSGYTPSELSPSLETAFRRVTLVDKGLSERITIDVGLSFANLRNGVSADFGPLAVIELKQDALAVSPMSRLLREKGVRPMRVSKYCIGSALTDPSLKQNRFKRKIRALKKLSAAGTE